MSNEYMVVWSIKKSNMGILAGDEFDLESDYRPCQDIVEARKEYDALLERDDLYSASIVAVIDSTDYDTHPDVRLYSRG
jgi:hypothetical protein